MNFLDTIVTAKQREVSAKRVLVPVQTLFERVNLAGPPRDFFGAIAGGGVIAELKAFTPTIGSFAHSESLPELAMTYQTNGAAAISIVADPERFGTSLSDVTRVRESVALPVIAKDFVVDPYQIVEARAAGADAVLLIVRLLEMDTLRELYAFAQELGISVLVETHSEEEVLAALAIGACIIGINNRDLDRMTVSLETTRRLAHLVPDDVVLVSESGIRNASDVADLASLGARAFLVGGSLLDADDPAALLRDMVSAAKDARGRARKAV